MRETSIVPPCSQIHPQPPITEELLASAYAEHMHIYERLYPKAFKGLRDALKGADVLDLGGGNTTHMAEFAMHAGAAHYTNVDIHDASVAMASLRDDRVMFIQSDITAFISDSMRDYHKRKHHTHFICNGLDNTSWLGGSDDHVYEMLSTMLLWYMQPGDYILGVHSPTIVSMINAEFAENIEYIINPDNNELGLFMLRKKLS